MLQIVSRNICDLIHPGYNPRQISDEDFSALKMSLTKFDAVEPAVINTFPGREGNIVGGNQRINAAKEIGWTEFPCVEVSLDETREKELNVRLNRNTGEWNFEMLEKEFAFDDLVEWGFGEKELSEAFGDSDGLSDQYSKKIKAPIYEIKGERPALANLCDSGVAESLIEKIDESAVPDDIKEFLRLAAARHRVFDYEKIAEYYAHSDKEVQKLFEDSALVIIDFDAAIEKGFVVLSDKIKELWNSEYGENFDGDGDVND